MKIVKTSVLIVAAMLISTLSISSTTDYEDYVNGANAFYNEKYQLGYDYFDYIPGEEVNFDYGSETIFSEYEIMVFSKNGVYKHGKIGSNEEQQYIGYTATGESIPNPDYPYTSLSGDNFETFNWLDDPWTESVVENGYPGTDISDFDTDIIRDELLESFLDGMEKQHGPKLGPGWETAHDWTKKCIFFKPQLIIQVD